MKPILSLGILLVGLVVGLGAPPAVAAQGELAGTWTSIDTDGSNQILTITGSGPASTRYPSTTIPPACATGHPHWPRAPAAWRRTNCSWAHLLSACPEATSCVA